MGRLIRGVALVAASTLSVVAAGCGRTSDGTPAPSEPTTTSGEVSTTVATTTTTPTTTTTTTATTTTATTTTPTTTATPTTTLATTTVAPAPPTTPPPTTTTTLPGEPVDWLSAGTVAHVAGVAVGETFVIRTLPGANQPVAASLPPLTELVLTGNGRDLDQGGYSVTWAEVDAGGVTGWISLWSLVYLGAPRDVTADAVSAYGSVPNAPTMLELAALVMEEIALPDPDSAGARLVRASDPGPGPTSEVVYDGFPGEEYGDDAALGARYRVVGRAVAALGGAYELVSVEARSLCTRGVDVPTGWCV